MLLINTKPHKRRDRVPVAIFRAFGIPLLSNVTKIYALEIIKSISFLYKYEEHIQEQILQRTKE